jgi:helicase associated domain
MLLQEFLKEYGRFPFAGEVYREKAIGTWLYHQRQLFRKGKLCTRHMKLLMKIDFMNAPKLKKPPEKRVG